MCFLEKTYEWIPALKTALEKEPEDFLTLCTQISEFLKNDAKRFDCFRSLNNEMLKQLNVQEKGILDNPGRLNEIIEAVKDPDNRNSEIKKITTHLLSDVLSANEAKCKFSLFPKGVRPHGQTTTYLGFVEPDLFRAELTKGRQWKDPTVPVAHGEFTHRIQWYMITTTLQLPQGDWTAFYKWIGTIKHVSDERLIEYMTNEFKAFSEWVEEDTENTDITQKFGEVKAFLPCLKGIGLASKNAKLIGKISELFEGFDFSVKTGDDSEPQSKQQYIAQLASSMLDDSAKSIFKETQGFRACPTVEEKEKEKWWNLGFWDALVDRNPSRDPYAFGPYNTDDELDFRAPENLAPYLVNKVQDCALLQAFLEGRAKKRTSQGKYPFMQTGNYLARKLYNLPLIKLDEKRQKILALLLALEDHHGAGSGWSAFGQIPILEPSAGNKVNIPEPLEETKQVLKDTYKTYSGAYKKYILIAALKELL